MRQALSKILTVLLSALIRWRLIEKRPAPILAPAPLSLPALSDDALTDRLWQIVRREQIPVLPRNWIMWDQHPGKHYGKDVLGTYDVRRNLIWMRTDYYRNPWVLAHELGHHALCKAGRWPHSEEEADAAGRDLLLSVITAEEAEQIRSKLDILLPALPAAPAQKGGTADGQ